MKKTITLIPILIILSTIYCFALDSSIWYKFPIPEFSYSHASISAPNILDLEIHGENSKVYISGGVRYDFFSQTENCNIWYSGRVSGSWYKCERKSEQYEERKSGQYNVTKEKKILCYGDNFGAAKYFSLFSIWGNGRFNIYAQDHQECRTQLRLEVGGGIGRIVRCTPVAKAIRLVTELDIRADENLILKIADIIGKQSVFTTKYKHTWEEVFYQEIADMIGLTEQGLKVRRILTSSIYETVSRSRGWELKIGYRNIFFTGFEPEPKGYITLLAEYVLPWGLNKQINLRSRCARDLDDDSSEFDVDAIFRMEHNYTWASYISLFADKTFNTPTGNENAYYGVRIGSEKNIFDKLVSCFGINFYKSGYSSDPYFDMWLKLKYYLW